MVSISMYSIVPSVDLNLVGNLPCISITEFEGVSYHVVAASFVQVDSTLPFSFYLCIRAEVFARDPDLYIQKRLREHFSQPGIYFSEDPRLASSDFSQTTDLLWAHGNRYCVMGAISRTIVARRIRGHQGKRFFARGCNSLGYAGNHLLVQILDQNGIVLRTALRGQMPISFMQRPNMRTKPKHHIRTDYLIEKHISLTSKYLTDRFVFFNLIDNSGQQGQLSKQFLAHFERLITGQQVKRYIIMRDGSCEFVHQLSQFKYGCAVFTDKIGYVHVDYHATISKDGDQIAHRVFQLAREHVGVYMPRINCVDSLDRTNSFTLFYFQWAGLEVSRTEAVATGNLISQQYASSDAMKQDLVLYGERTVGGMLTDLARRAFVNSLVDGRLQDGYRIVQNELSEEKPVQWHWWILIAVMSALAGGLEALFALVSGGALRVVLLVVVAAAVIAVFLGLTFACGEKFAVKGRL